MSKRWNENEIEFIHDNGGVLSFGEMALKLRRTESAVRNKYHRNRFRFYDNFYSYTLLEKELGRSRKS